MGDSAPVSLHYCVGTLYRENNSLRDELKLTRWQIQSLRDVRTNDHG